MLNESITEQVLDSDEYMKCCPTLGTLMVARFSAPEPERHSEIVYGADGLFFATYPERRVYLRPAFRNEFDVYTSEEDFSNRPMLWVIVQSIAPGYHLRLPVWRGKNFWNGPQSNSDQNVFELLIEMSKRNGMRIGEFYSFLSDQRARKACDSTVKAKDAVIH